jgi:hypothetical protein
MPAIDAVPLGDELVLGLRIMHQDQIGIAMDRRGQRLAAADDLARFTNRGLGYKVISA